MQINFVFLIHFICVTSAILQDGAYIDSLAANIEKSGLAKDFSQSWREHIRVWNALQEQEENEQEIGADVAFNCNTSGAGNESADSVHKLQPYDIGIIGALGASLVAGNGADAKRLLEVTLQYRGLSFPIGGEANLSVVETLPNILKEYNPNITGWSRNIAPAWFEYLSQLNVAAPGERARDLEAQAKELIKRIKRIPGHKDQWKLISIFIGANDLCEACDQTFGGRPSRYGRFVRTALDLLHRKLTRTVVNLIALPHLFQWYSQLHDDPVCVILHKVICPCIFKPTVDRLSTEYNAELYKLADQYDREDFAVIVQPLFTGRTQFPNKTLNGTERIDQSYFAPDCFHFGRKLHAVAARALWANMFQPIGEKHQGLNFTIDITCPNQECPYIRTSRNSDCVPSDSNFSTTDEIMNHTHHPHHYNSSSSTSTSDASFTLTPWGQVLVRNAQMPEDDSEAKASTIGPWVALIVVLSLGVIATSIIGVMRLKQHRRMRRVDERTPLLNRVYEQQLY